MITSKHVFSFTYCQTRNIFMRILRFDWLALKHASFSDNLGTNFLGTSTVRTHHYKNFPLLEMANQPIFSSIWQGLTCCSKLQWQIYQEWSHLMRQWEH